MYRQQIQFPLKEEPLREDVHALGDAIGQMLREQGGEQFLELVEGDRRAAIARRERRPMRSGCGPRIVRPRPRRI